MAQPACAPVEITENRKWVRLAGLRYDLQLWRPDIRTPKLAGFTVKYPFILFNHFLKENLCLILTCLYVLS